MCPLTLRVRAYLDGANTRSGFRVEKLRPANTARIREAFV